MMDDYFSRSRASADDKGKREFAIEKSVNSGGRRAEEDRTPPSTDIDSCAHSRLFELFGSIFSS